MSTLSSLSDVCLDHIIRMVNDGSSIYKLRATGESKLNHLMENGGVTRIKLSSLAHDENSINESALLKTPRYWWDFKRLRHMSFEFCSPQTVAIPDDVLVNLLSLKISYRNGCIKWDALIDSLSVMQSLNVFKYNSDWEKTAIMRLVLLPNRVQLTLTVLHIGVPSCYILACFPKFLTDFEGRGKIFLLSDSSMAERPEATELDMEYDSNVLKILDLTPQCTSFPETLTRLKFKFVGPSNRGFLHGEISIIPFCNSLPAELRILDIKGLLNEESSNLDFIHLLPRSVEFLRLNISNMKSTFPFEHLPPVLKELQCNHSIEPSSEIPVILPHSLVKIHVSRGIDIQKWLPSIEFPNQSLRVGPVIFRSPVSNLQTHGTFHPNMISSFELELMSEMNTSLIVTMFHGLREVDLKGDPHITSGSIHNMLTVCKELKSLRILLGSFQNFAIRDVSLEDSFISCHSSLTRLRIDACPPIVSIDFGSVFPNLKYFECASLKNERDVFHSKSLPPLKVLKLDHYRVNLQWLLNALPTRTKVIKLDDCSCELSCEMSDIPTFMPTQIGSTSKKGLSMDLSDIVHLPPDSIKLKSAMELYNAILRNHHIVCFKFNYPIPRSRKNTKRFCRYKKREDDV